MSESKPNLEAAIESVLRKAPRYVETWRPKRGGVIAGELLGFNKVDRVENIVLLDDLGRIIEIEAAPWMKSELALQKAVPGNIIGIQLSLVVREAPLF